MSRTTPVDVSPEAAEITNEQRAAAMRGEPPFSTQPVKRSKIATALKESVITAAVVAVSYTHLTLPTTPYV